MTATTRANDNDSLSWIPSRDSEAAGLSIVAEAPGSCPEEAVESPRCVRGEY